jgi:hypothetical protein
MSNPISSVRRTNEEALHFSLVQQLSCLCGGQEISENILQLSNDPFSLSASFKKFQLLKNLSHGCAALDERFYTDFNWSSMKR